MGWFILYRHILLEAFQEYFVRSDASSFAVIANEVGLPWSVYIGMAGMPGQTAYVGWNEFSKAKKVNSHTRHCDAHSLLILEAG